jgi:hypothetical protein
MHDTNEDASCSRLGSEKEGKTIAPWYDGNNFGAFIGDEAARAGIIALL